MQMSGITMRRGIAGVLAAGALAGLTAGTIAPPMASAAPPCDAAGLNTAISTVATQTAAYLSSHPSANDAITNAGTSGDAGRMVHLRHSNGDSDLLPRSPVGVGGSATHRSTVAGPAGAVRGGCGTHRDFAALRCDGFIAIIDSPCG